jgi:hypothetical protein
VALEKEEEGQKAEKKQASKLQQHSATRAEEHNS